MNLPKGTPECYSDPAYGPNSDVTGDCDFLPTRVFKAAWPGVKEKWPAAYEIIKDLNLTVQQQQLLMGAVDVDGKKAEDVAKDWFVTNEAVWRPIVDAAIK